MVDEVIYSAHLIDITLDLSLVKHLEDTEPTKAVRFTKAMKLATSSKITKAKKLPILLTCLSCYDKPKRGHTQSLARSNSLRRYYRQVHF